MDVIIRYDALRDRWLRMSRRNNLTDTTLRAYESVTGLLRDFLQSRAEQGIIKDEQEYVSFDDIQAWIDAMMDSGNKASTVKQRLVTANQFFTFATKPYVPAELRYELSPVSPDFYPKTPTENIPEALTDEEITELWKYDRKYKTTDAGFARNYAIVALILTTGLRNKEVLDLNLDSIDLANGEVWVHNGKGRKDRIVDMDSGGLCAAALENYLLHGDRPRNIPDSAPLFGTTAEHSFGKPQATEGAEKWHRGTGAWLSALIERHVFNQTGRHDCRSHDLRHTYARLMLNSTGNLAELQSSLGHSDPKISERYSGRLLQRRRREQTRSVLAARDAAAEQLRQKNEQEQTVIPLFA